MPEISGIEEQALIFMLGRTESATSCTELGAELWGNRNRHAVAYARPAGKLLWRLKGCGLVEPVGRAWRLTTAGRRHAAMVQERDAAFAARIKRDAADA